MQNRVGFGLLLVASVNLGCVAADSGAEELAITEGRDLGFDDDRARACAQGETLRGVDVSYYQGAIDWAEVRRSGVAFAFARVADGAGFTDPMFAKNWPAMRAAGVVRGPYQFFRPAEDPSAQAKLFVDVVRQGGGLEAGDIAPVLDVEVTDGVAPSDVLARARVWLAEVEAALGRKPVIYTSPAFWDDLDPGSGFDRHPLWVANWTASCPSLPRSWDRWTFWQRSDRGTVPGIDGPVDLDRYNGSLADLRAFTRGSAAPAAPRPAPLKKASPAKPKKATAKRQIKLDRALGALLGAARSVL